MSRILALMLIAGCSGETTDTGRKPPEICNDAIDNDDDGLVDCDDSAECGGLQCATGTESDTGPTVELPDLELVFDVPAAYNFEFSGPGDCPLLIGTYEAINRTEFDAELDANCNQIGGDYPFTFSAPDCNQCPTKFLTNYQLEPGESVTVDITFVCEVGQQTFTADCITDISAEGAIPVEVRFTPTGTFVD
jgi:hypothetical protein